ncbi:hypothetical protein WKW79_20115 [Variovorax robiniae]|uniref:Uncharacterized protein n=1 Tax=Variovorax robiniae TaxID=1836199 RepID=A0ABU8XAP4_9BURK
MKTLWTWVHAVVALIAWLFILVVLSLGLLTAQSSIHEDTTYVLIVLFVVIGHLSAASYLVRRIRDDLRAARTSHT